MNQLMSNSTPTMSSREIAELTGKQHSKVLRDIRSMLIEVYGGEHVAKTIPEQYRNRHSEYIREHGDKIMQAMWGDDPNWDHREARGFEWFRDNRGYITEMRLDRYHTEVLVTGYDVKRRAAVIKRWYDLETGAAKPAFQIPQSMSEALRLAADQAELLESQQRQLNEQAPKVAAHERIASTDGAITITEAAKSLQVNPGYLIDYMLERRWLYRAGKRGRLQAYQPRLDRGHLRHKLAPDNHRPQVLVTIKGVALLSERIEKEQMSGQIIHAQFGSYRKQAELL